MPPERSIEPDSIQQYNDLDTAKKVTAVANPNSGPAVIRLGRPPRGWVRKNLHIDQRKLDAARRALGAKTETETVDAALDAIALRKELSTGVQRVRAAGGLKDIYED